MQQTTSSTDAQNSHQDCMVQNENLEAQQKLFQNVSSSSSSSSSGQGQQPDGAHWVPTAHKTQQEHPQPIMKQRLQQPV